MTNISLAQRGGRSLVGAHTFRHLPKWRMRIWRYPDGGEEGQVVHQVVRAGARRVGARGRSGPRRKSEFSLRRARKAVKRKVRAFMMRWMVTFTFPGEGVHEYDKAFGLMARFIHRYRGVLGLNCYLVVAEEHPKGHGWHFHMLIPFRPDVGWINRCRVLWTEFLRRRGMPPSGGARYTRIDVKEFDGPASAARYAAKYVTKTLVDRPGRWSYRCSKGCVARPAVVAFFFADRESAVLELLRALSRPARFVWRSWVDAEHWDGPDVAIAVA